MHYIRIVSLIIFCLLLPLAVQAKREKVDMPDKPMVSDSILQCIFQFSPFYSRIIDEYKADLYIKGKVKVHKRNHLIRYVPSMFRFEKHINDYLMESLSELHYTAPDIYDRKIKAVSTTFPRNRGQITDVMDYLNMNIYSSSLMSDKLLSPLDKKSSRYYHYLLDSIAGPPDCQRYKILIIPKFRGTQLVSGYMWVSDQIWTIRELYIEGVYDVIRFKVRVKMGEEGDVEFLPVQFDLNLVFKFIGNHLEMDMGAWLKYNEIKFYEGAARRKSQKKHRHDLTESYKLTCDSEQLITDKEKFNELRPIPLSALEDSLYRSYALRQDTLLRVPKKKKNEHLEFWGELGDMLISSYNVNLSSMGSVHCSPLINPVLLDYSHSRGFSYKQKFKYSRLFHDGRILRISPQIGYNFTHKELYVKADADWQYWPEKQASFEVSVGNGNRIYSSVVLDQLKQLPDSTFNFDQLELDYFKDVYLNLFHNIEIVNGLFIKAGVSVHWRYLINNSKVILEKPLPDKDWAAALRGIRSEYNSFAPRIRIEWTPGMYYYMNGRRKMNVGSSMPTFMLDYERGIKGVFKSTGAHERWEFDIQQNLKLSGIRSIGYRIGGGMFTKQEDMYFVDFANFARRNLPEGWNDDIGGTFQLLDGRWYNSSRQYWRGNFTYESPFIFLKPLNRWLGLVQQERLYGGILFMPHLNPYIELGYGIGTHIFDVGAFVSTINGQFDTFGFKFTFELFNK